MSNDVKPATGASVAAKAIGAIALAAVLVLAGSIRSEAAPMTLTYSTGTPSQTFFFDDYSFSLSFDNVHAGSFDVTVNDVVQTPTALESRFGAFPGYLCVPFANGGTDCVDFEVTAPLPNQDQSVVNYLERFLRHHRGVVRADGRHVLERAGQPHSPAAQSRRRRRARLRHRYHRRGQLLLGL